MGAGFRRFLRRVLFSTGVLLVAIALSALIANQFRVVYVLDLGATRDNRVYFERGVVRYVWMPGSWRPALLTGGVFGSRGSGATTRSAAHVRVVARFSRHDAAFTPYEWLPRYTDDGSAASASVPWWMVGVLGGSLMCAGFWGIRAPRGHCRKCEYDLRGLPAAASVCPECGAKLPAASAPFSVSPCASSTSAHA